MRIQKFEENACSVVEILAVSEATVCVCAVYLYFHLLFYIYSSISTISLIPDLHQSSSILTRPTTF